MTEHSVERSIFITGAASGIGLETARLFSKNGWRVGLCDRDETLLQSISDELAGTSEVFRVDVTEANALSAAIASFCERSQGKLDALFNSAGIVDMRTFAETPLERQYDVMDINVKGVINGIHAALPFLRAATDARVVTMSSVAAIYGLPEHAIYCASKFAVRGLTEALNIELEADDIWVCDIMVAYVSTPMVVAAEHVSKSVEILGINVTPQEVAATVMQAVKGKQVHWLVTDADAGVATLIDSTGWNDRPAIVKQLTGF